MTETSTKKSVELLNSLLKDIITQDNESLFFEAIISEAYHIGMDSILLERIITDLSEKIKLTSKINEYVNYLDDIYTDTEKPNSGLTGLKVILNATLDSKVVRKTIKGIRNELKKYEQKEIYRLEVGSNKTVVLDKTSKTIYREELHIRDKADLTSYDLVINAYPVEIIIHDSPITDEARSFSIKWESKSSSRTFNIKQANIKDIEQYLEDAGYITNPRLLKGTLSAVIQISINNNLAIVKTEIDNPGFYYDDKTSKISTINYEIGKIDEKKLLQSVELIDRLGEWFSGQEDKLAHCLKWGFIAPFGYIKKQLGAWLPYLYLHGKAKSGKTTLAKIILYTWETPNNDNEIGGGMFDTVARVGNRLSQSTFPIVVNEPAGAFNKPSVVEIIKNCVESTSSRGKYEGRSFKIIPAFAPIVFASNHFIPQDDALLRRFNVLSFNFNERKSDEEKKLFKKEFQVESPTLSPLNRLKYISFYIFKELEHTPDLLTEEWEETVNLLLNRLYLDLGLEMPSWLKEYCQTQTLEDLDDEETELIRSFMLEKINRESKKIQVWDEEEYRIKIQETITTHGIKPVSDFKELIWDVANNSLISWMIPHVSRDNKNYICLNVGFKQDLQKNTCLNYGLKSIAQLLEFKYAPVLLNGKTTKVIKIELDYFIKFLYPQVDESIDNSFDGEIGEIEVK
jgi:hypothetical protein